MVVGDPQISVTEPPDELTETAKTQWRKLAPVLCKLRTLTEADIPTFSILCELLAEQKKLEKVVRDEGMLVKTHVGTKRVNSAVPLLRSNRWQVIRLLKLFGCSPRHRKPKQQQHLAPVVNEQTPRENHFSSLRRRRGPASDH